MDGWVDGWMLYVRYVMYVMCVRHVRRQVGRRQVGR